MTNEQYERWKDFSRRMARTCFGYLRMRPSKQWVISMVEDWWDQFDERYIPCIVSWDCSNPYPEGHVYYRRTYRGTCWNCVQKGLPRATGNHCHCENGEIYYYAKPLAMSDMMSCFWDEIEPNCFRCQACSHDDCRSCYPHYERSCQKCEQPCRCDEIDMIAHYQWQEQWASPVHCCIRAGLDMAAEPSAGVVGFTAGDIRRMYPDGVPEWLFPKGEHLYYWPTDKLNGTFQDLPDNAEIVL